MQPKELKVGDILQLNLDHKFGGMLVIVTEPKAFGCQGYLMSQFNFDGAVRCDGVAYVRPSFKDFELVGHLHWIWERKEKEEKNDRSGIAKSIE